MRILFPALLFPALLSLFACDATGEVRHAGTQTGPGGDSGPDSGLDSGDSEIATVPVGHEREMRGLYVATVYNIDWPSSNSLSAAAQQAEIETLLNLADTAGLNAIFIQIRPEGDALYRSSIEPWSDCLTGTQGQDPGYDPLEDWIRLAHARGIEVHAWINPYRAKVGSESTSGLAAGHMALAWPEYAYGYGDDVWMDPGAAVVRARVVAVITDLLNHYDLDGINFDDYFYPYPDSADGDFPDSATYAAYLSGGGSLALDDWRRTNTSQLVQDVSEAIDAINPAVRFGIAPFGIWRPGYPSGISGMDPYAELYADPLDWVSHGWLDYLAPQLYWETTNSGQEYGLLAPWWDSQMPENTWLFPVNALYQWGTTDTWTADEFAAQLEISRDPALTRTQGNVWYNASPFIDGRSGVLDTFAARYYPTPALPPPVNKLSGTSEAPLQISAEGNTFRWVTDPTRRTVTVYAATGDTWTLSQIIPADVGEVTLAAGRWALASVGTGGVESGGVVVNAP